jgi:hypothetical protein
MLKKHIARKNWMGERCGLRRGFLLTQSAPGRSPQPVVHAAPAVQSLPHFTVTVIQAG